MKNAHWPLPLLSLVIICKKIVRYLVNAIFCYTKKLIVFNVSRRECTEKVISHSPSTRETRLIRK